MEESGMSLFCENDSLITESDVEQKLIYPFLSTPSPIGLGYSDADIFTKSNLRRVLIGKATRKYYFPDYLVMLRGIPVLVVEAKSPDVDLGDAYAEARLYASEINAAFPHKINICHKLIVCNGAEIWAGYYDTAEPKFILKTSEINSESNIYVELVQFCSKKELTAVVNKFYSEIKGETIFNTPVSLLGGKRVQNEELVENPFGRTLVFENRNIFDPESEQDRIEIVQNAYITSAKRDQHIEPIYNEIRKIKLPSLQNSTAIATENPQELTDKILSRIETNGVSYSLILMIGSVGSGKSTFIRYFKKMYLESTHIELSKKCEWVFVNMNPAPLNRNEIYVWIKDEIINQIREAHEEIHFDDYEIIRKIFRREIRQFDSGIGQLLVIGSETYNKELFDRLSSYTSDSSRYLLSLLHYLKEFEGKLPIIVLDNCDKRNKDEQLLMFEVAQWLRVNYKCLIILPMRDSTYDNYKKEPPLDTVVKDLVFRIDPPDLLRVLQARLDYISRINRHTSTFYSLERGARVEIKRDELIEYFKCIMMAIRKNNWAMNIFYKLSNRNIREGIQLFEDLCKSGHIKSDEIFKLRIVGSDYDLPTHILLNALIRKNRKYFNDEMSNFINLFKARYQDDFPDPFVRIDILRWLESKKSVMGPNNTLGYHQAMVLIKAVQVVGHKEEVILREIEFLIKRGAIYSEVLSEEIDFQNLLKISPSGLLHLSLLQDINYLSACAEDSIYKDTNTMMRISKRISLDTYLEKIPMALTTKDLIDYHVQYRAEYNSCPEVFIDNDSNFSLFDLVECQEIIEKIRSADFQLDSIIKITEKYKNNQNVQCRVISKKANSIVCLIEEEAKGFLSTLEDRYKLKTSIYQSINENDIIECEIIEYNYLHNSFQLKYLKTKRTENIDT